MVLWIGSSKIFLHKTGFLFLLDSQLSLVHTGKEGRFVPVGVPQRGADRDSMGRVFVSATLRVVLTEPA